MGREISYSDFLNRVEGGQVAAVRLDGERVYVTGAGRRELPDRAAAQHRRAAGAAREQGRDPGRAAGTVGLPVRARAVAAVPAADRRLDLLHEPDAGRRPRRRDGLRQVQGEAADREVGQGDVQRRRRHRRGQGGARGDRRVPARPAEVLAPRRQDPEGRAARRPSGHRQDAARPRHRRRGGRAVLHHLGLGLRRDVRRRRREPRPRHVRAGQEERALHRLHRRDRRGRPAPRRRLRRRQRRARADAEPAPGRDGRLRGERGRDPDRRDQPARRARPGAAAPGPVRPAGAGDEPRHQGPREDPRRPRPAGAAGGGRRPADHRARLPGLLGRRSRQPRQRGGAARGADRQAVRDDGRLRGGQGQGHDGRRAALDGDVRRGAQADRLSRGRPRDRRHQHAAARPDPQGDDHPARPRAGAGDEPAGARPAQRDQDQVQVDDRHGDGRQGGRGADLRTRTGHERRRVATSSRSAGSRGRW